MTYSYGAGNAGPQAVTSIARNSGGNLTFTYGGRGNMVSRSLGITTTHSYAFDVENRLTSVTMGSQKTEFTYDAAGNRVLTVLPGSNATKVYTPFPDYEIEDPFEGDTITRTTYRLAGQMVAVQKKVGTAAGVFAYTYTDHLGNLVALSSTARMARR